MRLPCHNALHPIWSSRSLRFPAPIHPHAVSGNDDPGNGLALTPDAHGMFDREHSQKVGLSGQW